MKCGFFSCLRLKGFPSFLQRYKVDYIGVLHCEVFFVVDIYLTNVCSFSIISPRNMIAQAQSGTGKTATFLLAMLSRVDIAYERCQCLCMAPTRELAVQIANVGREMSRFIPKISFGLAIREETRKYA